MKKNNALWKLFSKRQSKENLLRNSLMNQIRKIRALVGVGLQNSQSILSNSGGCIRIQCQLNRRESKRELLIRRGQGLENIESIIPRQINVPVRHMETVGAFRCDGMAKQNRFRRIYNIIHLDFKIICRI
jgi:hypothetical protein